MVGDLLIFVGHVVFFLNLRGWCGNFMSLARRLLTLRRLLNSEALKHELRPRSYFWLHFSPWLAPGLFLCSHLKCRLGNCSQTNTVPDNVIYLWLAPALPRRALMCYRANGCAACHSQQVRQTGTEAEVL